MQLADDDRTGVPVANGHISARLKYVRYVDDTCGEEKSRQAISIETFALPRSPRLRD